MLDLIIGGSEFFDDKTQTFVETETRKIRIEHSLFSISKWESKFQRSFLNSNERTDEEVLDYIRMMVVDPFDGDVIQFLTKKNYEEIQDYVGSAQTATTFRETPGPKRGGEVITAELVYYWMSMFQIPQEYQYWHINRLFAVIRIANIKNSKQKPRNRQEMAAERQRLNAERKASLGTRG